MSGEVDIAVIGAGAAGIGAGMELLRAGASFQVLEARGRAGGRAWTVDYGGGLTLDLGCHWLHSADQNPWVEIADAAGYAIDRTPAPWTRRGPPLNFDEAAWADYRAAYTAFHDRLARVAESGRDCPSDQLLEPGSRWNGLLGAMSTYANGVELSRLSAIDYDGYVDSGLNWRLPAGFGALIASRARPLPIRFGCPVKLVRHGGRRVELETAAGTLAARAVIVTVPTAILAGGDLRFDPPLPDKAEAAAALPMGIADKVYFRLDGPIDVADGARFYGRDDRARTGVYHIRPLGRPIIEGYYGGELARGLEHEGEAGFTAFAMEEIAARLGNDIRKRLVPLCTTAWERDAFAQGSYAYAVPGRAGARGELARSVDERLYFAGEACSTVSYTTAHGALQTGIAAARAALTGAAVTGTL